MTEERTIDQLPIGNMNAMVKWYGEHLDFCAAHGLICFEDAYRKATKRYPEFMTSDNRISKAGANT